MAKTSDLENDIILAELDAADRDKKDLISRYNSAIDPEEKKSLYRQLHDLYYNAAKSFIELTEGCISDDSSEQELAEMIMKWMLVDMTADGITYLELDDEEKSEPKPQSEQVDAAVERALKNGEALARRVELTDDMIVRDEAVRSWTIKDGVFDSMLNNLGADGRVNQLAAGYLGILSLVANSLPRNYAIYIDKQIPAPLQVMVVGAKSSGKSFAITALNRLVGAIKDSAKIRDDDVVQLHELMSAIGKCKSTNAPEFKNLREELKNPIVTLGECFTHLDDTKLLAVARLFQSQPRLTRLFTGAIKSEPNGAIVSRHVAAQNFLLDQVGVQTPGITICDAESIQVLTSLGFVGMGSDPALIAAVLSGYSQDVKGEVERLHDGHVGDSNGITLGYLLGCQLTLACHAFGLEVKHTQKDIGVLARTIGLIVQGKDNTVKGKKKMYTKADASTIKTEFEVNVKQTDALVDAHAYLTQRMATANDDLGKMFLADDAVELAESVYENALGEVRGQWMIEAFDRFQESTFRMANAIALTRCLDQMTDSMLKNDTEAVEAFESLNVDPNWYAMTREDVQRAIVLGRACMATTAKLIETALSQNVKVEAKRDSKFNRKDEEWFDRLTDPEQLKEKCFQVLKAQPRAGVDTFVSRTLKRERFDRLVLSHPDINFEQLIHDMMAHCRNLINES
ncbi:hypothetical protein IQ250_04530 [Pseudanabaenaceae cyanobacterium LEGE 13415]|nr:hypothetical protein [Pseudanabaenaceae cyanobacterium LEGE 13415]